MPIGGSVCMFDNESINFILDGGGGGAQRARDSFQNSYLRNEYCYCNEIRWLFINFIGDDNGVLIRPVPTKPLPWQPLFQNPLLTILT